MPHQTPRPEMAFSYRDATPADLGLTYDITREAMQPHVIQTFGEWNENEQSLKHRTNYRPETHKILCVGGAEAGLVAVEDAVDHLWLVKLYLRSAFQQQGLGTVVLRGVIAAANSQDKPVRLRCLRANLRAQALYRRHGFVVTSEAAERLFMERAADSRFDAATRSQGQLRL